MSYRLVEYNDSLDLEQFYNECLIRGFENNSSKKSLVDCFNNEREKQVWLLYYNDIVVGSVASHSFDIMGPNCYRICARTCVFTDMLPGVYGKNLRTKSVITEHQNPTSQFFIPQCLEWVPEGSRVFITTNLNQMGSQSKVHTIFAPLLCKSGEMAKVTELDYRGSKQTVWELFPDKFYSVLNKYPRWKSEKS